MRNQKTDKNTKERFAKAAAMLYRSKKLRDSLAENAKEYLKKYNWEKEEKKYLELIELLR